VKAAKILEEAEKIHSEALAEKDRFDSEARIALAGKEKTLETQWKQKMDGSLKSLSKALEIISKEKSRYFELSSTQISILLKLIVEKLLYIMLDENTEKILDNKINTLLSKVLNYKKVVFKFNPKDLENMPQETIKNIKATIPDVDIRQDPSLIRSSVIVETDFGTFDASIESQAEMLVSLITDVFGV